MKKHLVFFASAALLCGVSLMAQDYDWDKPSVTRRVDCRLTGLDEPRVALVPILEGDKKPVNCLVRNTDPSLGSATKEEQRAFHLFVVSSEMKDDQWLTVRFSFKVRSRRKGRVRLTLRGYGNWIHNGKELSDVAFMKIAKISSPQFTFPNGGFFPNANLKPWNVREKITDKHLQPTVGTEEGLDTPGKKYLRTRQTLTYYLDVKPDQEITIEFTAKPSDYFTPLH